MASADVDPVSARHNQLVATQKKEAFVDAVIAIQSKASAINGNGKRGRPYSVQDAPEKEGLSSGAKVLAHRLRLGVDDESYLRMGIGLLWTGSDDESWLPDEDMYPHQLYSSEALPSIRKSVLQRLLREAKRKSIHLRDSLISEIKLQPGYQEAIEKLQTEESILDVLINTNNNPGQSGSSNGQYAEFEEDGRASESQSENQTLEEQTAKLLEELEALQASSQSDTSEARVPIDPADGAELRFKKMAIEYKNLQSELLCLEDIVKNDYGGDSNCSDGSAPVRRTGVWQEYERDTAIASDRVWAFVESMSGFLGEEANTVIAQEDPDAKRVAKEGERRRADLLKRVVDFQAKVVDTLVSGVLKGSNLVLRSGNKSNGSGDETLMIVDGETQKKVRELAAGEGGRPFFEANVAMRRFEEEDEQRTRTLSEVATYVMQVGQSMHETFRKELEDDAQHGCTVEYASRPRNAYFVRLRPDAIAAIRTAHARLTTESRRQTPLYVLVEGKDHALSSKFAQFCAQILMPRRMTSGASAIYVGASQANLLMLQLRITLTRLTNHIVSFPHPPPDFGSLLEETRIAEGNGEQNTSESDKLKTAAIIRERYFTGAMATPAGGALQPVVRVPASAAGWHAVGGARLALAPPAYYT